MFLRLSLPNGNHIDCDIIKSSFQHVQYYYNELKPAEDSIKLAVPFSVTVANALKSFINNDIGAAVYDDDSVPVFTGYVRKDSTLKKSVLNDSISIELVPPSFILDIQYKGTKVFQNKSVSYIVNEIFTDKSISLSPTGLPNKIIKFCKVEESTNIKSFLTQLLYETGYTYTFTNYGYFKAIPLFDSVPSVISQAFTDGDNGNMYGTLTQKAKERTADGISAEFTEIAYKENQTIFNDTSSKTIRPYNYLFDNSDGEYLTYDCDGVQSVLYINEATIAIGKDKETLSHTFTNWYTKGLLTAQNTGNADLTISSIKVTGSGWFVISTSKSKATEGDNLKEINLAYIYDKEDAETLVSNVYNYYKYSGVKIELSSKENFPVGSFCTVTAAGTGTYTCRIVKKVSKLTTDIYQYELESILDYTPSTITTATDHASNTGSVIDSLSSDSMVSSIEKQGIKRDVVVIADEFTRLTGDATTLGLLSSTQYEDYSAAKTELDTFISSTSLLSDMNSPTSVNRTQMLNLFKNYYGKRDLLQDKLTSAYVDSQTGTSDKGAVPVMTLSSNVVKLVDGTYTPSSIQFSGKFTNGTVDKPYKAIYEVFRNGSSEAVYVSSSAELTGTYTIPEGTESLVVVMHDVIGNVIYDKEPVMVITGETGNTSQLSNRFQVMLPTEENDSNSIEFRVNLAAYSGTEQRPVYIKSITGTKGISTRTEGTSVYVKPEFDIEDSGTVKIKSMTEVIDGMVLGIGDMVIGMGESVFGDMEFYENNDSFEYSNYNSDQWRENTSVYAGVYLGTVASEFSMPAAKNKDYILWVGTTTDTFKKGHLYIYDGVFWNEDNSNEHMMATLDSMLPLFSDTDNEEFFAKAFVEKLCANRAFITQLFAKVIRIKNGGSIASDNYSGIIDDDGHIVEYGDEGFAFGSDGSADLVNVHATGGTFEEVSVSGSVKLTSGKSLQFETGSTIQNISVSGTTLTLVVS